MYSMSTPKGILPANVMYNYNRVEKTDFLYIQESLHMTSLEKSLNTVHVLSWFTKVHHTLMVPILLNNIMACYHPLVS